MKITNPTKEELNNYYKILSANAQQDKDVEWVKYVDLGVKIVRIIAYSKEFIPLIQKQLTYTLKDSADSFDETLIVWKEKAIKSLPMKLDNRCNPKINLRARIEMLVSKQDYCDINVFDDNYSKHNPLLGVNMCENIVNAHDVENKTYYYGVEDLTPEEFIKQGHIFVQIFNKILKTPITGLVHGALVGLNNNGILFCARGQRGKSTLAVLSMLRGFEYVSDDYLTLSQEDDGLYSYPIYSIITLAPRMYNELYYELNGKFVSNNARKDKYVINIENYHGSFRKKYPIKVCMFPEIVTDSKPSIVKCSKGRAITQLVHSTINQMNDKHDIKTINKLMSFVKDFDYYQINLCSDIWANVECLREFTEKLNIKENENDKLCVK